MVPDIDRRIERAQPIAVLGLGRDCRVVDQRMQFLAIEPAPDLLDGVQRIGFIGEIDLDEANR